jgi:deazaflavin-dependent oxidoreductase (nitroreductase family)
LLGRSILLLTTTGRKTGKQRVTPLQFERDGDRLYVAAARGKKTDWIRNLQANPEALIRMGRDEFPVRVEVVDDPNRIADFLALRLKNRPRFVSRIMRFEGFPANPRHEDLVRYAQNRLMVVLDRLPNESVIEPGL